MEKSIGPSFIAAVRRDVLLAVSAPPVGSFFGRHSGPLCTADVFALQDPMMR